MTQAGEILPGTDTVSQGAEAIPELFDDASLTAIWWDTHDFMNAEQRLLMARQVYPLCKSDECRNMLKVIIADLEAFVSPKPLADVAMERLRVIMQEHPVFTGVVALSLAYMLFGAGMSITDLIGRYAKG